MKTKTNIETFNKWKGPGGEPTPSEGDLGQCDHRPTKIQGPGVKARPLVGGMYHSDS